MRTRVRMRHQGARKIICRNRGIEEREYHLANNPWDNLSMEAREEEVKPGITWKQLNASLRTARCSRAFEGSGSGRHNEASLPLLSAENTD